jgi:site-specific recombinase XerD
MATLFKRSNGYYYFAVWKDGRRIYRSTKVKNRLRALEVYRVWEAKSEGDISLSGFVEEFLCYAKATFAPRNVENYERVFKHLLHFLGDKQLKEIDLHRIEKFKVLRLKRTSPTTVSIDLRAIKAAFNKAVDWNYIDKNPCKKVSPIKIPDRTPSYLAKADFRRLYYGIKEEWLRDIVLFAVVTGMREGEVINLKWESVEIEKSIVHVRNSSSFRSKMGKERAIPLNSVAARIIKARPHGGAFVFTDRNGEQIRQFHLTHIFKKYVRKVGLGEEIHFHSLRHTFASWLVQEGVPLYYVQKLLGHSSINVTQVYSHTTDENLRKAVEQSLGIDDIFEEFRSSSERTQSLLDLVKNLSRN